MTDAEHKAALARVDELIRRDPAADSADGKELCELADRIVAYEKGRWPFEEPTAEEMLEFRRDQELER